jgi:hypothetical protein
MLLGINIVKRLFGTAIYIHTVITCHGVVPPILRAYFGPNMFIAHIPLEAI